MTSSRETRLMVGNNRIRRRTFLKTASAATMAAIGGSAPGIALGARQTPPIEPAADTLIVLWMAGGMAHVETFDPKRHTPYRAGMNAREVVCTYPPIDTVVDPIKFTAGLESIGSVIDRGTVIRSHVLGDLGQILHSRHQFHWHTGYEPPLTVAAPHLGAWIAHARGPRDAALPPFIDIGQPYEGNGEAEELKAFQTAGFLEADYGPFRVPHPEAAAATVRPPAGMSHRRFRARYRAYQALLKASPQVRRRGRPPSRGARPVTRQGIPAARFAGRQGLRFVIGVQGDLPDVQHGPLRTRLPPGPTVGRGGGAVH